MILARPRPIAWQGNARMGMGWGCFVGFTGDSRVHAHHAVQILLAESPQRVWTPAAGWQLYGAIVIAANVPHQIAPTSEIVTLIYVEPDSDPGRSLQRRLHDGVHMPTADRVTALRSTLLDDPSASPAQVAARLLDDAADSAVVSTGDALIQRFIDRLPHNLPERPTAASLARSVGLSASRFQHRFRANTGMALRPYLRWRRLLKATFDVLHGSTLTAAAADAGFADAAHFTRTFRRHFGITPKALLALNESAS